MSDRNHPLTEYCKPWKQVLETSNIPASEAVAYLLQSNFGNPADGAKVTLALGVRYDDGPLMTAAVKDGDANVTFYCHRVNRETPVGPDGQDEPTTLTRPDSAASPDDRSPQTTPRNQSASNLEGPHPEPPSSCGPSAHQHP